MKALFSPSRRNKIPADNREKLMRLGVRKTLVTKRDPRGTWDGINSITMGLCSPSLEISGLSKIGGRCAECWLQGFEGESMRESLGIHPHGFQMRRCLVDYRVAQRRKALFGETFSVALLSTLRT